MELSLTEIEAKALRLIQKACPSELMDVIALKSDQKSRLIFIVLQCKGSDYVGERPPPQTSLR